MCMMPLLLPSDYPMRNVRKDDLVASSPSIGIEQVGPTIASNGPDSVNARDGDIGS
jgi:hypothetical protein